MSIATTKLDEFRLTQTNLDMNEQRLGSYGAYEAFRKDAPNLIPNYAALVEGRASEDRTTSVVVTKKNALSTSSSRACTVKTAQNTSAYVTPSWTTVETGFMQVPAEYKANYLAEQTDFNLLMRNVQRVFLEAIDTAAYTHLNANKSAVNNADGNPYTVASNYMQVPNADNELYFNELGSIMIANDLTSEGLNVIASPRTRALVGELSAQGQGNSDNRAFQFMGYDFQYSRRVSVATGMRDTVFAAPIGSLAYLHWIDNDAKMGNTSGDGKEWFREMLPLLGHDVGVLFSSTCADKSGLVSGYEAALTLSFTFSFDYTFISAYNSDSTTLPGSIFGAQFSKT